LYSKARFQTNPRGVEADVVDRVRAAATGFRRTLVGLKPEWQDAQDKLNEGFRRTLVGLKRPS